MHMKKHIPIILTALMALACTVVPQEPSAGKKLGEIYVSAAPGSRSVLVKLDGLWRVRPCDGWLSTDVNGRSGRGAFTFHYASNESDLVSSKPVRRGAIVIESLAAGVADTLYVRQQGVPDGREYESVEVDSYIEFLSDQMSAVSVLYANLQDCDSLAVQGWISSAGADVNCIIYASGPCISRQDGKALQQTGTITEPSAVFAETEGLNLALADFGAVPAEDGSYYDMLVKLLSESYDKPDAEEKWLVGGSFYYLSAMETGYPSTPEWYPENPASDVFAADRYAQAANLSDCVWMTARDFTPTWTSGGRSWRADYVYASNTVWNATVAVKLLDAPAGAAHKAILVKIKF